jgi:hypothetical protein
VRDIKTGDSRLDLVAAGFLYYPSRRTAPGRAQLLIQTLRL